MEFQYEINFRLHILEGNDYLYFKFFVALFYMTQIRLSGFNDKLPIFLETVLLIMTNLKNNLNEISFVTSLEEVLK